MDYNLHLTQSLNTIINKLDRIIELQTPKSSKDLLLEHISTYSADVDPNFTNNDIGLSGGADTTTDINCNDKLCTCGK